MGLKDFARRFAYGPKASSEAYVAYLRSLGMVMGEEVRIYSPIHCVIDQTRPWMIEMGDNVHITEGVTILTHGYDWSVFKGKYGDVLGSAGRTTRALRASSRRGAPSTVGRSSSLG